MTGNQDKAARAAARLEQIYDQLDPMLDKAMIALDANPLKPGDALTVQRYVRGVELVARAARAIATLITPPGRGPSPGQAEDNMNDDDRDDSPETLGRLRAEIESRLNELRATIETKRLVGWTVVGGTASDCEQYTEAA